jgi:hypothetical protein
VVGDEQCAAFFGYVTGVYDAHAVEGVCEDPEDEAEEEDGEYGDDVESDAEGEYADDEEDGEGANAESSEVEHKRSCGEHADEGEHVGDSHDGAACVGG